MKSINTNRVLMLIALIIGAIGAQGLTTTWPEFHGGSPPGGVVTSLAPQLSIPYIPKVGETFEVTFTILCKQNMDDIRFGPNYSIFFTSNVATIISGKEQKFYGYIRKGETKQFKAKMIIKDPVPTVSINAIISSEKKSGWPPQSIGLIIFLVDPQTGQYGTKEEYEGKLPVEYRYDPVDGSFTCSPSQNPAPVEENRRIIKMIKQFEPALSDSEALLLHSDQYRVGIPKGLPKWHEENKRWLEEEVFEYYLKDGWFESLHAGKREAWIIQEREKIMKEVDKHKLNFFRPDNSHNRNNNYYPDRFDKDFYGQWWYKDHNYNKDQGLLATAVKRPIKNGKARLLMTYMHNSVYYRVLTDYNVTDDSGYFCITFDIPQGATGCKAYPIVYPSGPVPSSPKINVSDPNITQPDYWKDTDDQTLFIMRELGVPTYHDFYANGIPCTLGVIWTDTFPQVSQPQSGCINIYETYLHARTFMSPPPTRPLRCLWEPGYSAWTGMDSLILDTVWICGDTAIATGTDEWDDDILLHEFGHYLMDYYAEKPPSDTGGHSWPISYPEKPGIGYGEGWAHFFSCRARVGSGTDTLIVNTARGIGGDSVYLCNNIEDPWIASFFGPDTFMGGPWCEGAVAGALWDIYDSKDEMPYHSYPYPGFPDTALADTLTMDFDTIWTVFDDYDPQGEPTNCWTIFAFRSGWDFYNYGHQFALNQIFLHHRIRDSIPAQPTSLFDSLIYIDVYLRWDNNDEADLDGYRIIRRGKKILGMTDWSDWAFIGDNTDPNDTTFIDTTVLCMWNYRYKVTAYDTMGCESEPSDSVQVSIPQSCPNKSPMRVETPIISCIRNLKLSVPAGSKEIAISIYDCCGRAVSNYIIKVKKEDNCKIKLHNVNNQLPSGVYFVHLETDEHQSVINKIIIVR